MVTSEYPISAPSQFTHQGHVYNLIEESLRCAIYKSDTRKPYEVHVKRVTKADYTFPNGTVVPAGSYLKPGNNDWGRIAWSPLSLERAREIAARIDSLAA